jgi:hypothetical protein
MEFASVHVSNWSGYRQFQEALARAGWEHFPTLKAELPESNDGKPTPPTAAARALQEVRFFREQAALGNEILLVDGDSSDVLYACVESYDGVFIMTPGLEAGVDQDGFFIRRDRAPRQLFRSSHFRQDLLEPARTERSGRGRVRYVDLSTGSSFVCRTAVPGRPIPWPDGRMQDDAGRCRSEYPRSMRVELRKANSADYAYIVDALTEVLTASVEIGNPVVWC